MKKIAYTVFALTCLLTHSAIAAVTPCGNNCQLNYTTTQDIADVVNDFLDHNQNQATVTRNDETGVFTVTLPDGSLLSVAALGLTIRNQNMAQQRQMTRTMDGDLHLHTQSGLKLQLRNAFHHEPEAIGAMLRAQWRNMEWFRNRFEIESPAGERMCLEPAMQISAGQPADETTISTDTDGRLLIRYRDGIQQHLQACAHDMTQLRDQIRSQLQQQLQINNDGTVSVMIDGLQHRFRLEAMLRNNGILDQPGFFTEQNRLYFRYRDGWEQEIVAMP